MKLSFLLAHTLKHEADQKWSISEEITAAVKEKEKRKKRRVVSGKGSAVKPNYSVMEEPDIIGQYTLTKHEWG